jgi:winged helix DNA-binding protein
VADRTLNLRELNRATLARQMLLKRESLPVLKAVERLVGLQAQLPIAPYVGLWTRLHDFSREDLARAIETRKIVKATLMRATLHLCSADDYLRFRTTLQPMLSGTGEAIVKQRGGQFDSKKLLAEARRYIGEKPRTFAEISDWVMKLMPGQDVGALRYTVRTNLPLVQTPIPIGWSYPPKPQFALAESWIGRPTAREDNLPELVRRYLSAFGPASVTDAQTWLGMKLKETFDKLRPELQTFRDEGRRELFDLPDQSIFKAEMPAPVRFLPEFDNLLLSHSNRTRVVADELRSKVYLPALRVAATVLIDGFVQASWKVEKSKDAAILVVQPFARLAKPDLAGLLEEGERLVKFVEPMAKAYEVRVSKPI